MKIISVITLAISLYCLLLPLPLPLSTKNQKTYDNMQMVQTWTPTFCAGRNCKSAYATTFSLHGLWPADKAGHSLDKYKCTDSAAAGSVSKAVENLKSDLQTYWPNILIVTNVSKEEGFWVHEWDDHGICSSPVLGPEHYFKAGIQMRKTVGDLKSILKEGEGEKIIIPSDHKTYAKNDIIKAITDKLDVTHVYISCKNNGTHSLLYEVFICFNTAADTLISCPKSTTPRGCNAKDNQIVYPEN